MSPEFTCFRYTHICYVTLGSVNCTLTLWEIRSKRNKLWFVGKGQLEGVAGEN